MGILRKKRFEDNAEVIELRERIAKELSHYKKLCFKEKESDIHYTAISRDFRASKELRPDPNLGEEQNSLIMDAKEAALCKGIIYKIIGYEIRDDSDSIYHLRKAYELAGQSHTLAIASTARDLKAIEGIIIETQTRIIETQTREDNCAAHKKFTKGMASLGTYKQQMEKRATERGDGTALPPMP